MKGAEDDRRELHDVCLIGQVSRDIVRIGDAPPECSVGGGVHFAGIAYRGLGLSVTVLTKAERAT